MKTVYITRNELFKGIDMLLMNNINLADESFIENNMELFEYECSECKDKTDEEKEKCEECGGNGYHENEIYQYFACRLSDREKEMFDSFQVPHGYSELLDIDIIPVYDWGTSWSAFSYSKEVADDYELAHNETLTRTTVY
jgi:hypothetical protein